MQTQQKVRGQTLADFNRCQSAAKGEENGAFQEEAMEKSKAQRLERVDYA